MKTNIKILIPAICGVLALSAGCGKETTPDTETPTTAATAQSQAVADAQPKADEAQAAEAEKVATAATEQDQIQSLIDKAKTLAGEDEYVEALNVIGELSKLTLSPEQQTLVDGLKKTAQQQLAKAAAEDAADGAANALGGALGDNE